MTYINLTLTQCICLTPDSMTTLSNGTQENKTGCSKRKLENLSGEMSTSHKNKKSRSSRDHKVDLKSDHKGGHKGDDRGAHKGDRKGYHNVDHKGDHKRDHKVDHNDDSTTNGAKEKISGGISQQTTENRKSRPKPADEKTENKKKSGSESTTKEAEKGNPLYLYVIFTRSKPWTLNYFYCESY